MEREACSQQVLKGPLCLTLILYGKSSDVYKLGLNGFLYCKTKIGLLLQILKLYIQKCILKRQMVPLFRDKLRVGRHVKSNRV